MTKLLLLALLAVAAAQTDSAGPVVDNTYGMCKDKCEAFFKSIANACDGKPDKQCVSWCNVSDVHRIG